jgi:hypothetical protein
MDEHTLRELKNEVIAKSAQAALFLAGLVVSIVVGMMLGRALDGPGGLLIATVIAGAGLLTGAALSQVVHDRLIEREPPTT